MNNSEIHRQAIILLGNYKLLIQAFKNNKSFPTYEDPVADAEMKRIEQIIEKLEIIALAE